MLEPFEALNAGTAFPCLIDKYKETDSISINYKTKKENILSLIQEYEFICLDLLLYLDLNEDKEILDLFNKYNNELKKLKLYYENNYGLLSYDSILSNKVDFNYQKSWPWEN